MEQKALIILARRSFLFPSIDKPAKPSKQRRQCGRRTISVHSTVGGKRRMDTVRSVDDEIRARTVRVVSYEKTYHGTNDTRTNCTIDTSCTVR